MGAIRPWHIAILVVVLILLFGAKKLPDAARGLGRSLRIIKAETKTLRDDDERDVEEKSDAARTRKPIEPELSDDIPSPIVETRPVKKPAER